MFSFLSKTNASYEKLAYQQRYPEAKTAKKEAPIHSSILNRLL